MRVMMLLKSDAQTEAGVPPSEELITAMGNYTEQLAKAGVLAGGEALQPSSKGAKVRITKGKTTVIDGPFAEAKEVIAGYLMLDTQSLAQAIDWANRMPIGDWLTADDHVELRPLYEPEDFAVEASGETAQPEARADGGPEKGRRWVHLLMADKNTEAAMPPNPKLVQEMGALMQEMAEQGVLITGDGLKPTSQSARVHISADKKIHVVDGPFTETKEIVAGFTVFRAKSKAEAIEWARRCLQIHMDGTGIETGEIEVLPVAETGQR